MKNEVKTQTTRIRQDWPEKEKKMFFGSEKGKIPNMTATNWRGGGNHCR